MIKISLYKKELKVSFENKNYLLFNKIKDTIKKLNFTWNPTSKIWSGPAYKHDELIEALCDLDQIEDNINKDTLDEAISGEPEIEFEKVRRIPDYSLMNFPYMKGKAPNENFQDDGIKKGINRSRYAFYWSMGLGKSYVAAAIIAHRLYKYHDAKKVLLLTTSIGVRNLKQELKKFIKDLDESKMAIGDKDNRLPFKKDIDIVIASYNSFRLICEAYKKERGIKAEKPRKPFLPLEEWFDEGEGILILDESHEVANRSSLKSHYMSIHAPFFKYRYLFSGTPADNPEKLYNQLDILDPWLVYNLSSEAWKDKMAYIGTRFSRYAIREWKPEELEKSNKRFLEKHGNYYKTSEVIDLPDYIEKKIYLDMKSAHREIYQRLIIEDFQKMLNNGKANTRDFVNRFPYMLLAVDFPELLKKHEEKFSGELETLINKFKTDQLEKLDALDDIIENHPNEKILVWAIHPKTIEAIGKKYPKMNPICITGATEESERNALLDEFKTNPNRKLLVANITTLNTSVTLTNVTTQVYVERGFNYSQYEQSTRRIYRIGQDHPVISYILIYENCLDVLVDKNLSSKGKLIEGLLSKNFISQDEWQQIFNCKSSDTNLE